LGCYTHTCPDGTVFEFVWDGDKEEINQEKHEWTFNEAVEAFCDPKQIRIFDRDHSTRNKKRFVLLGKVTPVRIDSSMGKVRSQRSDPAR
jgi:uncharacterized DUF497 family protein